MQTSVAIIGAGPAGLTAAYLLAKEKIPVVILEKDPVYVGGIARTAVYKGYCFDIGGHRFFSKSKEVEDFWSEILPQDMLVRPRSSRIFYQGKFFSYPLKIAEVLKNLGLFESFYCFISYLKARGFPTKNPRTFSQWVINHFGKRLFNIFFKTYTEKVWGMSCDEISADWAAQRIQGLSFFSALKNAITPQKHNTTSMIKTLINSFRYPRKGPGMLWEACTDKIKNMRGQIMMGVTLNYCRYDKANQHWIVSYCDGEGKNTEIQVTDVISSAPLREMVEQYVKPPFSPPALQAAAGLKYRDFLIVVLILKDKKQFFDNWIYIHDPCVDVGRIQNFKSWSPEMVPNDDNCCYGMEYFCFEGDGLWSMSDAALMQKATAELVKIGLAESSADVLDGCVVRQQKAYPVYDDSYQQHIEVIRQDCQKFPSLHLVGRNGMHKYNNQDHAMMTAMLTAKNIIAGKPIFDVWGVNQDAEYHESGAAGVQLGIELRKVPTKVVDLA